MSVEKLLEVGVRYGVRKAITWLGEEGVTISDELVEKGIAALAGVFVPGPGVTHADKLVVVDERSKE